MRGSWFVVAYLLPEMTKSKDDPRDASLEVPASLPPHWKTDEPGVLRYACQSPAHFLCPP